MGLSDEQADREPADGDDAEEDLGMGLLDRSIGRLRGSEPIGRLAREQTTLGAPQPTKVEHCGQHVEVPTRHQPAAANGGSPPEPSGPTR